MALRRLKPYTVLITSTGKAPITLTLSPSLMLMGLVLAVGLPVGWIIALMYHNGQLAQRNQTLTETAHEVLTELDAIDAEIELLKNRAGLPEGGDAANPTPANTPQGGVAAIAPPEALFAKAKQQLPDVEAALTIAVKPALEATLAAEAEQEKSFPSGKPLLGKLEVSSEFGLRLNPFGGSRYEMHEGLDFSGPVGQPILATAEGVVVKVGYEGGYGNLVRLDHGYSYETLYAHLSKVGVQIGDRVKRGEVVGYLGNTGRSSGPHLHYSIYRNGQAVNPRYYLKLEMPPDSAH